MSRTQEDVPDPPKGILGKGKKSPNETERTYSSDGQVPQRNKKTGSSYRTESSSLSFLAPGQ